MKIDLESPYPCSEDTMKCELQFTSCMITEINTEIVSNNQLIFPQRLHIPCGYSLQKNIKTPYEIAT